MKELENVKKYFLTQQEELINKYFDLEDKCKKIVPVTTKKMNEKVELRIELGKIEGRIIFLNKIIETISVIIEEAKQDIFSSNEAINKINSVLERKFLDIDIISTQHVLSKEFATERKKGKNSLISFQVFGGSLFIWLLAIPLMQSAIISYSILNTFLITALSFTLGYSLTGEIVYKIINEKMKIFNHLNQQLGENALLEEIEKPNIEEYQLRAQRSKKINEAIIIVNNIINELVLLNSQLINQKQCIETKKINNNTQTSSRKFVVGKLEELKSVLQQNIEEDAKTLQDGPTLKKTK